MSLRGARGAARQSVPDLLRSDLKAVICAALFVVLEGGALRSILKGIGYRPSLFRGLIYSTADVYFSAITPSATGGQPASAYFMYKDGVPAGAATVALIVNLIMYTLSILVLGIAAMIVNFRLFWGLQAVSRVLVAAGFVCLSLMTAAFLLLLSRWDGVFSALNRILVFLHEKHIVRHLEKRQRKLVKVRNDFRTCAKTMRGRTGTLIKAFFWNLGQRVSQLAVPMCLYLALGGKAPTAGTVFASQCLSTIGFTVVPIPGAMGVADYLMIDGFTELLGRDGAFRLEMLSRGISFYICVAASGIITLIGYLLMRRRERGETQA